MAFSRRRPEQVLSPGKKATPRPCLLWVECYSSLIGVLSSKYPTKTPEFMAYLKTIVHASKSFAGDGWVTCDSCYTRKAAVMKSLDWSQLDFTLYNETFAGMARAISRCKFCNSDLHLSADCIYAPEISSKLEAVTRSPNRSRFEATRPSAYACHLYNHRMGSRCRFSPCKFAHHCTEYKGPHPASQCRSRPPTARARSPIGRGRK